MQTLMPEETLTKEMSPTTDPQKLEMTQIPYRQVVGSLYCGWSRDRELILPLLLCVVLSTVSILGWLIGTRCYEY